MVCLLSLPIVGVKYGSRNRKLLCKINIMFNTHWKTHKKSVQTDTAFTRGEIQAAFLFTSFCGKMWNPSELAVTQFKPHNFSIEAREKLELAEVTQRTLMTTKNPVLIFMGLCLELRWDLVYQHQNSVEKINLQLKINLQQKLFQHYQDPILLPVTSKLWLP